MIKAGDSLQAMRQQLDLSGAGSLTENHMRARARKHSGPIAMSDLHGKVCAIGEVFGDPYTWINQQYWVDRKANIPNSYNPAYTTDWSYSLGFAGSGARDGLNFETLNESFDNIGDIGYGPAMFGVAEPGNYNLKFSVTQLNTPGATRAVIVEVLGCTDGYISGGIEYYYRETTRLANPLTVDMTITVLASHPYVCPTFTAITKNNAIPFTGCEGKLDYLEITKL